MYILKINNYKYESDWRPYAFPKEKNGFTSKEELCERFSKVDFNQPLKAGGIPIISDGKEMVIDDRTIMSIIYGSTGSGKTRKLIVESIMSCILGGESMIIPDIKGELSKGVHSSIIRGLLEQEHYNCIFIDFREMLSDGFNVLHIPYKLYKSGKKDEASQMISELVKGLASIYKNSKADPFWEQSAKPGLEAIILLLFEICDDIKYINMHTVKTFTSETGARYLKDIVDMFDSENLILTKLRALLSQPERTKASTLATIDTFIEPFLSSEKLSKMLSHSTFDVEDIYKKKTALFIILPDENDTYERICGFILQQINETLILEAYKNNGLLPRRVNFICDEFCNYRIPNMSSNISASRSRNVRWIIVCQSKKQLQNSYGEDADTIIANCENIFFFNSTEPTLLSELSESVGITYTTKDGIGKPIITVQDLKSLKKSWDCTEVFFTSRDIVYISSLPDIAQYEYIQKFHKIYKLPIINKEATKVYTPRMMYDYLSRLKTEENNNFNNDDNDNFSDDDNEDLLEEIRKKFDEIFGSIDAEEE